MKFIKTKERHTFDGEKDLTFTKRKEYGISLSEEFKNGDRPYTIRNFHFYFVGKKISEKVKAFMYLWRWLKQK